MKRSPFPHPLPLSGCVELAHGSGGRATAQLIAELFATRLDNPLLRQGNDGTDLGHVSGRLVVTTDAHVVTPHTFPGGDIGSLAIHGTINDLAMMGAEPRWLTAAFILEAGFPLADLAAIIDTMAAAASRAGVAVVAGDTKVVERGQGDGIYITTSGIGVVAEGIHLGGDRVEPGDQILLSGTLGDHAMAVMAAREQLSFDPPLHSDSQPLHRLVAALLKAQPAIHCLRDPTRGGVAATLNEIAWQAGVGIELDEAAIPLQPGVRGGCELLGLDPLHLACEGRLLAFCRAADTAALLALMRNRPESLAAAVIGEVVADPHHFVQIKTALGGYRMVDWIAGEQLPRIC